MRILKLPIVNSISWFSSTFVLLLAKSEKSRRIHDSNAQARHDRRQLMRVNSTNILDEGLRIGGIGRRINSKVKVSRNKCISKVNLGVQPDLLSI
jgi:hypothetical protein